MSEEIGVYIHIPFCRKKCYYCDFISYENCELQEGYVEALVKEIKHWKENNQSKTIKTVYLGGGTPSYINSKSINRILHALDINKKCIERTIEINPGTVDEEKLRDYKEAGINRISIGLQSTKNELLELLGRIHKYEDFLDTYRLAKKVGFNNINVDLMIGLPNQLLEDVQASLNEIVKLDIQHISVYSLIVEAGTKLSNMIKEGIVKLPQENLEREMYWLVKNILKKEGFKHYEISNFSKEGFESKHNLDCWNQKEYIGFGAAAHSYIDGIRFSNNENLKEYIENIKCENYEKNRIIQENKQSKLEMEKEFVLLGLRKIDGVSLHAFKGKFKEDLTSIFETEIKKLEKQELIFYENNKLKLTNKGIDLANIVWQEFV